MTAKNLQKVRLWKQYMDSWKKEITKCHTKKKVFYENNSNLEAGYLFGFIFII